MRNFFYYPPLYFDCFWAGPPAADFCIGSSNNGWIVWKDKDGQTLDEVYRKQLDK